MMTERPILFSAPMIRAILSGTKTQTRRVVKPVGNDSGFVLLDHGGGWWPYRSDDGDSATHTVKRGGKLYQDETPHACRYGRAGDRLWVRETFDIRAMDANHHDYAYRATCRSPLGKFGDKWTPSIHMPRWASRILLEIVAVRVERLKEISEADAVAEGIETVRVSENDFRYVDYLRAGRRDIGDKEATRGSAVRSYATLWESINGPGSWDANPWVWVVEFRRVAP